ncbi:hypothetical protein OJ997_29345 [Solirubrobacter phytolaccae]|uniref:Virginiamycin B lyase n=1 Tax=Solirubrobacter phytolaccae TaxID=1404360 RepID=A0A9X3SCB3_9ACTN|nr:hypothetical protein [Solirubrobacter phytolaccae]MDA0184446.1 hypothetical protein [Solirubrobacter phytolaccae]
MRALATMVAVLALAAPAQAQDVFRLPLGHSLDTLVATPDGGVWGSVWTRDSVEIRRVTPDGAVRITPALPPLNDLVLGPDGLPWLLSGGSIERVDAAGTLGTVAENAFAGALAVGPDGTGWMQTQEDQIQRITPDGTITSDDVAVPGCRFFRVKTLARASDGAMWFFASGCGVVRWPVGGAPAVIHQSAVYIEQLVPDGAGGMWFSSPYAPGGGHFDVTGQLTRLRGLERAYDVAVAPDGSAWFTTGRCRLARANADRTVTLMPTAIPARQLEFAPDGGIWLGSGARLQRTTLGASAPGCDSTPPKVTIAPKPQARVSLAALRRHRGFTITVREPFAVQAWLIDGDEGPFARAYHAGKAGTVRLKVSPAKLRQLMRRKHPVVGLQLELRDREGNSVDYEQQVRLTR